MTKQFINKCRNLYMLQVDDQFVQVPVQSFEKILQNRNSLQMTINTQDQAIKMLKQQDTDKDQVIAALYTELAEAAVKNDLLKQKLAMKQISLKAINKAFSQKLLFSEWTYLSNSIFNQ